MKKKIESEVWKNHPSIYHYTKQDSCTNILLNNSFQLSKISPNNLNDNQELILAKKFIKEYLKENHQDSELAETLLNILYDELGEEHYLISFGAFLDHNSILDKPYIAENGLLSMWRAYGNIALVFNTKEVCRILNEECPDRFILLDEVIYSNDEDQMNTFSELNKYFSIIKSFYEFRANNPYSNSTPKPELAEAFMNLVYRIKHKGFREENEVRIALCNNLPSTELKNQFPHPKLKCGAPNKEKIEIKFEAPLPIEKIIIGPSPDQSEIKDILINFFYDKKLSIPISCSKTPYIPNN